VPLQAWAEDRPETDDTAEVSARLQGPDPRPPSLPADLITESAESSADGSGEVAPVAEGSEAVAMEAHAPHPSADAVHPPAPPAVTRVPISFDGDGDSDVEESPQETKPTAPAASTAGTTTAVSSSAQSTASTQLSPKRSATSDATTTAGSTLTPSSGAKEKEKRGVDAKKPTADLPAIRSSYDLERELKLAFKDIPAVGRLLKRLKLSQVGKVLSDLMEPSVLHLLLVSVNQYYGERKRQYAKVADWFAAVRDSKRFPSQYALLGNELKDELRAVLAKLREVAAAGDGGEESVPTVTVVDALISTY
jgi:hypothetical protein